MGARAAQLVRSQLLKRGWTGALIARFLPAPDQVRPNPMFRSAPPMRLYAADRVAAIEASPEFLAARREANARREKAARSVATKRARTLAGAAEAQIEVPILVEEQLIDRACRAYNTWNADGDAHADRGSSPLFLQRICVNYLRHELTAYDDHLGTIRGKVGTGDAYAIIRAKALDAIAAAYPWLSEECARQRLPRDGANPPSSAPPTPPWPPSGRGAAP